jgi:3-oxoacyl-[acyl-carrier-protein] synthase-3
MPNLTFSTYRIAAIATSAPAHLRTSQDFSEKYGQDVIDKIIKNVGVVQGYVADERTTTSDLCEHAANTVIEELGIERDSIDALLFVSQTPDYVAPSTACVLQMRLGLSVDCLAYDINLACSGFVYGLSAALSYLSNSGIKRVLLLCGDTVSKHCSPADRGLVMLSYDAGSAVLIDKDVSSADQAYFKLRTIGAGYRSLIVPYGGYRHRIGSLERTLREPDVVRNDYDGYMNGADVFKFSITEVPKLIKDFKSDFDINYDQVDRHILHQANLFIMRNIAKRVGIDECKMPVSIDRYGNTGAATIPLTICDYYARNGDAVVNETISVCGFGIGLSLGVAVLALKNTRVFKVRSCADAFEDNIDNLHNETRGLVNVQ